MDNDSQIELEGLAQLLDSMTMVNLSEVSKVASKVIRKVAIDNDLDLLHEVAPYNPFF